MKNKNSMYIIIYRLDKNISPYSCVKFSLISSFKYKDYQNSVCELQYFEIKISKDIEISLKNDVVL